MSAPAEKQDSRLMRAMFGSIAPRYDYVTRILSYGMDRKWKRLGVERAVLPENAMVLDLAGGTGERPGVDDPDESLHCKVPVHLTHSPLA